MTILSKDTLALINDRQVQDGVEKVLKQGSSTVTVTVSKSPGRPQGPEQRESTQEITLRRLPA